MKVFLPISYMDGALFAHVSEYKFIYRVIQIGLHVCSYLYSLWCISHWYVLPMAPPHLVYHHGNVDGEASAVVGGAGITPSQHFIKHSPEGGKREERGERESGCVIICKRGGVTPPTVL